MALTQVAVMYLVIAGIALGSLYAPFGLFRPLRMKKPQKMS
jgi:hypothetical protein